MSYAARYAAYDFIAYVIALATSGLVNAAFGTSTHDPKECPATASCCRARARGGGLEEGVPGQPVAVPEPFGAAMCTNVVLAARRHLQAMAQLTVVFQQ